MTQLPDIDQLLNKVKQLEHGNQLDLSSDEDLSIAIMNLISLEEHLFFSGAKTGNNQYYQLLKEVREMRKQLLKKIVKEYEGEVWCVSKHLLSASMRLIEVGTKAQGKGDESGAQEMFKKAYQLYSLFWGINLGVVKTDDLPLEENDNLEVLTDQENTTSKKIGSVFDKLGELVKKVVNCCKE